MKMSGGIARLRKNAKRVIWSGVLNWIPDKTYLKLQYWVIMGRTLHLDDPKAFTEKLQWLKLYNRKPEYTTMVDKYAAKKYIASIVGEEYIVPTLGVWKRFDDIDFDALPDKFVLKCNHDSGNVVICKNKAELDKKAAKALLERALKRNFYWIMREWPYKNVEPRIICEPLLEQEGQSDLSDYKFYCFDGQVKVLHVTFGRGTQEGLSINFYDEQLNQLPVQHFKYPNHDGEFVPPVNYQKMVELAALLSKGIPHVRVDFYDVNGKLYVGELTLFSSGGMGRFKPDSFDMQMGQWLTLPSEKK